MSGNTFFTNPQIHLYTALWAAVIIIVSGMAAGILPAIRALEIKAIDAIREEN
jgi:putative ABC transport system permease protein